MTRPRRLLLALALLARAVAPAAHLPFAPFALSRPASPFAPPASTADGTSFATVSASLAASALVISSPDGRLALALAETAPASRDFAAFSWSRRARAWVPYAGNATALGFGGAGALSSVYDGGMGLSGHAWLAATRASDGTTVLLSQTPSRGAQLGAEDGDAIPFATASANGVAACAAAVGALIVLPSGGALAALAAGPPFAVTAWSPAGGCLGSTALDGTGEGRVYSFAVTATTYFDYKVYAAMAPTGCTDGAASCASAAASVIRHASVSSGSAATALLAAAPWAALAVPLGGAANIVGAFSAAYVYAAAAYCPATYAGQASCACGVAGYPLVSSASGGAWAYRGCVPLVPQSILVSRDRTIHVAGRRIGSTALALAVSADWGATWRSYASVAGGLLEAGGAADATALRISGLALAGGPVFLTGMDPTQHGGFSGCFSGSGQLGEGSGCAATGAMGAWAWVQQSMRLAESLATFGDDGSVAVLGQPASVPGDYYPSACSGTSITAAVQLTPICNGVSNNMGGSVSSYWAICKSGFIGTWWFSGHAQLAPLLAANNGAYGTSNGTIEDFFTALAWGDVSPRVLVVVDSRVKGVINNADQAIIDSHADEIGHYVSAGGGFLSNTQVSDTPTSYSSTAAPLSFCNTAAQDQGQHYGEGSMRICGATRVPPRPLAHARVRSDALPTPTPPFLRPPHRLRLLGCSRPPHHRRQALGGMRSSLYRSWCCCVPDADSRRHRRLLAPALYREPRGDELPRD